MKLRFLVLGLLAVTASVASAHALKPPPERPRALLRATEQAQPPPPVMAALPLKVSAPPARSALASDAGSPPVPVLFSPRRPFVPAAEAASTGSPPAADTALGSMTEQAAKAAIEADGYKSVRALARGPDGVWKASAMRGQTEVRLSVGRTGSVSAN